MKWFYENTYEEARKYTTLTKFQKGSPGAHNAAKNNDWIKDYTWMPSLRKTWTYEEAKKEAQKYKTRKELQKNNRSVYHAARKNGWMKDYDWFENGHMIRAEKDRIWTYDKTKEEANKYKSRSEFKNNNGSAYDAARKHKWLDEFFPKTK